MSVAENARDSRANAFAPVLPAILAVAALACVGAVFRAATIVPLHVSLDPDEGWNAYHAAAAMAGRGLYPGPSDLMVNNYPPLSFYLVGLVGVVVGDQIVAGRIVSLVSFLAVWALLASILRVQGACLKAALLSALLFAALLLTASDYVGMDDPQLFGHAFQLAGAFLLLRAPRKNWRSVAAAALFVAGGFIKHNLFALPLAALVWLAIFDRRNALRLALYCAVLVIAGWLGFRAAFGTDLLAHLNSARGWSIADMWRGFADWLPLAAIPLCALGVLAVRNAKSRRVAFVLVYAAIGIPAGITMLGGAGVDVNAMFDADVALVLTAGLSLDGLLAQRRPLLRATAPLFAFACFVPFVVLAVGNAGWSEPEFWLHPMRDEATLAAQDIAFLRAHPGPGICESLAWCYWAGKTAPADVFNLDQQFRSGSRNPAPFVHLIKLRRFSSIELDEMEPFPFPASVEAAIKQNYRIDHTDDDGTFYLPR